MTQALTSEQLDASNPQQSVWVSASAGTGKTRVLVNRIMRLFLLGSKPERILCITYTKAGAAEVVHRIQEIVTDWSVIADEALRQELQIVLNRAPRREEMSLARRLLPAILQTLGGMRIMTIHAFCQSVLSRFPLEAQISPGFNILDDIDSLSMLYEAKQHMLRAAHRGGYYDLVTSLAYLYGHVDEDNQNTLIQNILLKRHRLSQFFRRFGNDMAAIKTHLYQQFGLRPTDTLEALAQRFIQDTPVNYLLLAMDEMKRSTARTTVERAEKIEAWLRAPHKDIETYYRHFFTGKDTANTKLYAGLKPPPDNLVTAIEGEIERLKRYKESQSAFAVAESTYALTTIARAILDQYDRLKTEQNVLDYEDQIIITARLLTELSNSDWVLYKLDGGIDHILVDEAQDTSPAQWDIVTKLAEEFFTGISRTDTNERTIFIVGDEKQSIFSFQNADPIEFARLRHFLAEKAKTGSAAWRDIALIENFRSSPLILDYADATFNANGLVPYLSEAERDIRHIAFHGGKSAQINLWPLVAKPNKDDVSYTERQEYVLAQAIANHIKTMLDAQTILPSGKTIQPGDIMILVRKRHPMVTPLTKALKERNINVAGMDRIVLKDQLAAQDCLAALQVGLNPYDDYNLACFLKSPFIGLSEEDLFTLSHNRSGALWDHLAHNDHKPVVEYCRKLAQWVQFNTPSEMLQLLGNHPCPASAISGRHALIRRLGYEADDIFGELLAAAKNFETLHPANNRNFLTWILHSEAAVKKQGAERDLQRVRIMTVHASKGLQAPIVILVDTNSKPEAYKFSRDVLWQPAKNAGFLWTTKPGRNHPEFQQARQDYLRAQFGEYYRLLYVAVTRAEEQLIICGTQSRESHKDYRSWHDVLTTGLSALDAHYLRHNQPRFTGEEQIVTYQQPANQPKEKVQDHFHSPAIDNNLRVLPPNEGRYARHLRPSQPPGTEPAAISPLSDNTVISYRRGQVIHHILAIAPNYVGAEQNNVIAQVLSRETEMNDVEKNTIRKEVAAILSDPRFHEVFSTAARAEVPVVGQVTIDNQPYNVSGQIDRLLVTPERIVILDYKTNRPPAMNEAEVPQIYRHQLRAYKLLLEKIYPGRTIETALLWTAVPYLLPVTV